MKISEVSVRNFRSLKDVKVRFESYTSLVGANGSGKSAVIKALNLFFYHNPEGPGTRETITDEDYHGKDTSQPIRVEILFTDLSDEAIDDLGHYVRNRELRAVTEVKFDEAAEEGVPKQYGIRPGMEDFREFFVAERDGARVPVLQEIFNSLRERYPEISQVSTKARMMDALRDYEQANPQLCTLMQSEQEFYGFTRGQNRLARHLQWVYIPAVKDASTEQSEARNTAFGDLIQRTVRATVDFEIDIQRLRNEARSSFQSMLDEQQSTLDDLSQRLDVRIARWAHPDASLRLLWQEDPNRSVQINEPHAAVVAREGSFEGHIGRFGHGLQRSFLLALLQELAELDDEGPTLILACEEPELYQHPPQARYLASVLQDLAIDGDQMIVTTHSPAFVAPNRPETVRLCRIDRHTSSTQIAQTSVAEITELHANASGINPEEIRGSRARIYATLQSSISEMFFAHRVILVEGLEDNTYIEAYLDLLELKDEFRRLGCHIVTCNGKGGIIRPLAVCKELGIHVVVVFDTDSDRDASSESRERDSRENSAILSMCGIDSHAPFPSSTIWGESVVGWKSNIADVFREDIGERNWIQIREECARNLGPAGELKKNPMFICEVVTSAWERQLRSCNLEKLCRLITKSES